MEAEQQEESMSSWGDVEGVVVFPDGVSVRGTGLRRDRRALPPQSSDCQAELNADSESPPPTPMIIDWVRASSQHVGSVPWR